MGKFKEKNFGLKSLLYGGFVLYNKGDEIYVVIACG